MSLRECTGLLSWGLILWAGQALAITHTNERTFILISNNLATAYASGFNYASHSSDTVVDSAGNLHIVKTANAGHLGNIQYRRWSPSITNWSSSVVTFGSGDGTWDTAAAHTTIDTADRIHFVYQHRVGADPWQWYHTWCSNASSADPLTLANWTGPFTIPEISNVSGGNTVFGSLISVDSNLLLFARGGADRNGDAVNDIWIDKAEWNGSTWDWSYVDVAVSNRPGYTQYGGLYAPRLMLDSNGVVHMHFRDDSRNGYRSVAYTRSETPTHPVESTWMGGTYESHNYIDATTYKETQGGTGILDDGTPVALVWAFPNRDGTVPNQNFSRTRDADTGWGAWTVAFTNDARGMPGSYGGPHVSFAPDGVGGLFCGYGKRTISHWDPETRDWMDVFTNIVESADAISSLGAFAREHRQFSFVYYYKNSNQSLYVGSYRLRPPPPTGTVILLL